MGKSEITKFESGKIVFKDLFVGLVRKVERRGGEKKSTGTVSLVNISSEVLRDFEFDSECSLADVLEQAQALNMPIAILPQGRELTFFGSLLWQAKDLFDVAGGLEVTFNHGNAKRYFVDESHPDFLEIKTNIKDSRDNSKHYWFTIMHFKNQQPQIVQAIANKSPSACDLKFESAEFVEKQAALHTNQSVHNLFDALVINSLTPANQSLDLIPYGFVSEGCIERSHKAADLLMDQYKVETEKIWLLAKDGYYLKPFVSDNYPQCEINTWALHVATLVNSDSGYFVLDPSVFDCPVSIATWRHKFDNGHTLLYKTSWQVFKLRPHHCTLVSDPKLETTNFMSKVYAINLVLLWNYFSFPPYACP